jgi:DNA-binding HxlR family transcriptional regulator
VEYRLTERGRQLGALLDALDAWATAQFDISGSGHELVG